MKLWLLTQDECVGWDTYDSAIVAAETEDEAQSITPHGNGFDEDQFSWAHSPDAVLVKLIGEAIEGTPAGLILASFNAG